MVRNGERTGLRGRIKSIKISRTKMAVKEPNGGTDIINKK